MPTTSAMIGRARRWFACWATPAWVGSWGLVELAHVGDDRAPGCRSICIGRQPRAQDIILASNSFFSRTARCRSRSAGSASWLCLYFSISTDRPRCRELGAVEVLGTAGRGSQLPLQRLVSRSTFCLLDDVIGFWASPSRARSDGSSRCSTASAGSRTRRVAHHDDGFDSTSSFCSFFISAILARARSVGRAC